MKIVRERDNSHIWSRDSRKIVIFKLAVCGEEQLQTKLSGQSASERKRERWGERKSESCARRERQWDPGGRTDLHKRKPYISITASEVCSRARWAARISVATHWMEADSGSSSRVSEQRRWGLHFPDFTLLSTSASFALHWRGSASCDEIQRTESRL